MKIKAITQDEPRQKDFWDIYELSNTFSLKEMIEWATTRDEWSFTEKEVEAGFKKYPTSKNVRKG